jgi:hypothetical protein
MYRGTFDSTGPIGTVGNAKLGYRLIGAAQAGDFYFYNLKNTRDVVFPEFQVDLNNTMVRVWLDFQNIYTLPNDMDLVTPQGKLYTGAGRREENLATGDTVHYQSKRTSFEFLQKISDNWQMRLQASNWFFVEDSPIVFDSGGDNWTSGLLTYTARMDNITIDYWVIIDDFNGHYNLGPVPNQDAFGFSYANELTDQYLWATSPFGTKLVPFASAAAINALEVPAASEFGPPANEGSHTESYLSEIYWQHTIDVVPRYLTVVGGLTWANITSSNVTDISILPWQATDIATSKILHRVGVDLEAHSGDFTLRLEHDEHHSRDRGRSLVGGRAIGPPAAGHGLGIRGQVGFSRRPDFHGFFLVPPRHHQRGGDRGNLAQWS